MLQPLGIGHVVLKVRDLDRSLAFYRDFLGFTVSSEMSNVMIFLTATGENHHDLALLRVGRLCAVARTERDRALPRGVPARGLGRHPVGARPAR